MDGDLTIQRLRRQELRLVGHETCLLPFAPRHMQDPAYLSWLRDADVIGTLNLPRHIEKPIDLPEIAEYCERMMSSDNDLFLAIHLRQDDAFIGTIKAGHIDWYAETADVGVMIGRKDLWGRGLAQDAIATLCRHLFSSIGLRRLTAGSMANNPAMIHVFEKLGFLREGVFRQQDRAGDAYVDHVHLGCLQAEFLDPNISVGEANER